MAAAEPSRTKRPAGAVPGAAFPTLARTGPVPAAVIAGRCDIGAVRVVRAAATSTCRNRVARTSRSMMEAVDRFQRRWHYPPGHTGGAILSSPTAVPRPGLQARLRQTAQGGESSLPKLKAHAHYLMISGGYRLDFQRKTVEPPCPDRTGKGGNACLPGIDGLINRELIVALKFRFVKET
jgi:hypothetical protein